MYECIIQEQASNSTLMKFDLRRSRGLLFALSIGLPAMFICGCTAVPTATPSGISTASTPSNSNADYGLFLEVNGIRQFTPEPQIIRSRFVSIDPALLIDGAGGALSIKEIPFNLFPDVVYTGVVEQFEQNGGSISWSGYLKDIEYSYFTLVFTSGVFMGHFASPLGVFEAGFVEPELYRIIQIDQTKFPGGEG